MSQLKLLVLSVLLLMSSCASTPSAIDCGCQESDLQLCGEELPDAANGTRGAVMVARQESAELLTCWVTKHKGLVACYRACHQRPRSRTGRDR